MADPKPPKEVLENLDLYLNMAVFADEKDWSILQNLDDIPPEKLVDQADDGSPAPVEVQDGH